MTIPTFAALASSSNSRHHQVGRDVLSRSDSGHGKLVYLDLLDYGILSEAHVLVCGNDVKVGFWLMRNRLKKRDMRAMALAQPSKQSALLRISTSILTSGGKERRCGLTAVGVRRQHMREWRMIGQEQL